MLEEGIDGRRAHGPYFHSKRAESVSEGRLGGAAERPDVGTARQALPP